MLKEDIDLLKSMVHEYGGIEMVGGVIIALRGVRDTSSDMGLKKQAVELDQVVRLLEDALFAPDPNDPDTLG